VQPIRKVAAILSADVAGYTRLMGDDDVATIEDIVTTRKLMAASVESHGGRLVDSAGDSMLADFPSAIEALRCSLAVQGELARRNASKPEHRRMALRIGLNLGDIIEQDAALYGDGVNVAARLQALGEPGGICVSASIHELVEGRLPIAFAYAGEHLLKNVDRPMRVYHVRDSSHAPLVGTDVRTTLRWRSPGVPHNLPRRLSSFIGREAQMGAVAGLLARHGLVTLVGPGGVGKTRLSLQVATLLAADYPQGVWFVELAALSDARLVPQAVANALGVKEEAGHPVIEALVKSVGDRRILIVLDNCEHVAQACAELAHELLRASSQLSILATSREPLHVSGEVNYPVPALALPDDASTVPLPELSQCEAIRLFVERAWASQPEFRLTESNAPDVRRICQRLDGIPLAIELAAARVRTLPVQAIAARLDDRFQLLVGSDRTVLPRQQTLRALIDWSHDLLTSKERALLRRLAVFAGGWTLEAAEAVGAGEDVEGSEVLDLLARLVEKSLVVMESASGRYRLMETVRQYALEQLRRTDEEDATRSRHLDYFLLFAEAAHPNLSGALQRQWLERLDPEQENFLAAHAWCDHAPGGAQAGLRLVFALKLYLFNRGLLLTLSEGCSDALTRPAAMLRTAARCRVLHTAGQAAYRLGRPGEAMSHLDEALSIARELEDSARAAAILQQLGMITLGLGDFDRARGLLSEGLELARRGADRRELAAALNNLAQAHRMCGEVDAAEPLYEQALAIVEELQDHENIAVAALNLALVDVARGQPHRARSMLLKAHEIAMALNSMLTGQCVLAVASGLAALREDWVRCAALFGAAEAEASRTGIVLDPIDKAQLEPLWARARNSIGASAFTKTTRSGLAMPYAQAMAETRTWLEADDDASVVDHHRIE